jgi:hypothetical protein
MVITPAFSSAGSFPSFSPPLTLVHDNARSRPLAERRPRHRHTTLNVANCLCAFVIRYSRLAAPALANQRMHTHISGRGGGRSGTQLID